VQRLPARRHRRQPDRKPGPAGIPEREQHRAHVGVIESRPAQPVLGDVGVEGSVGVQASPPRRVGAQVGVMAELEVFAPTRWPT
jgi:hypothetical protein